jgi:hypothetical protein
VKQAESKNGPENLSKGQQHPEVENASKLVPRSLKIMSNNKWMGLMTRILIVLSLLGLQGCTVLAVADAAGSAAVYAVKTVVNTVDAVTPDVVNKKK